MDIVNLEISNNPVLVDNSRVYIPNEPSNAYKVGAFVMIIVGISLCFLSVYVGDISVLTPSTESLPIVDIQGPMTLLEISSIQTSLEYQAFLDNLALSPIGDL